MTFPVYLRLFGLNLHPHLIFESLGYTLGFLVFRILQRRQGDAVPPSVRWSVIAAAAVGAVIGSKLLYWLEDPRMILAHWKNFEVVWGGKTIIGGLLGGLIAVEWVKKRLQFTTRTGDLFAVPLCVGIAIGRIGCFLTGLADDTYGTPTTLPWGVNFGDGILRHPTQAYDMVFLLLLACALLVAMRRPHQQGDIFKMFMVGYNGWRLAIDFIKPDPRFWGMNSIQWVCLAVLLFYSRDIGRWLPKPRALAVNERV
ncbi:MAG TPA: prolipoprotein diacylglyceryl transferase family protein [Candidatus Saccharimonadales bacterium]|jgi:phosphatidylglycerol:prolipoprotein diacylglycerol transferase|nr:prolipoprotein diacylglyceryl transferase family protein [Candidatus Saccharimonadales bacterium]